MDQLLNLLDNQVAASLCLGFFTFALFNIWRKASARWVHWFPLVAKVAKFSLYGAAILLALLAVRVLNSASQDNSLFLLVLIGFTAGPAMNQIANRIRPKEKVRRGTRVADVAMVNKMAGKLDAEDFQDSFELAGIKIPRSAEPYHFFVVGSTGTGKSVAITNLLDELEQRGDIALVVDSGGGFASRYYNPSRDAILNPFDDRCTPWSPTAEMNGPWDAEALAKSMIPDGIGESKEWNGYAQTLVTSVLRQLHAQKRLSIRELLYFVQAASMEELTPLLAGTPAAAQLVSEKTFGSIRTIAANYLATYAYLTDSDEPFSISSFIRNERPGFLFLTYRDDQLDSLRNMISCALDVAARTILALPANRHRRVWLIIDEFASIGKVQSIEAVATKSRKMGGCLLIGLQSVSQLKDRYGEHGAQTILSCLSSWLVLRCSDADTSEYVSKYIGDTEVSRMTRGESSSDTGGSDSLNEQIQTQRAVMPVELQALPNLQGFFKLAGNYPIASVKLGFPRNRDKAAETYAQRDFDAKPMLSLIPAAPADVSASAGRNPEPTQQADEAAAPAAPDAAPEPPAPVKRTVKVVKSAMEDGPVSLEGVLYGMADQHENDYV
ncbi:type IV secretion system DNA-binding domain-containing protein [Comamonas thiooxydans]|uniref:type IV secretion system DNA-binding domain-containing protein n=1 Tax=Comamonas thiooxydans TaxID=363952 RepID=UPI000B422519|nr:type IV secretion system DNA-binding domain-containing protein [Comamonas thiooxydans]